MINHLLLYCQVWLLFLLSALTVVGVFSLLMICNDQQKERVDEVQFPSFFLKNVYRGTEYVLTIITSQGWFFFLVKQDLP